RLIGVQTWRKRVVRPQFIPTSPSAAKALGSAGRITTARESARRSWESGEVQNAQFNKAYIEKSGVIQSEVTGVERFCASAPKYIVAPIVEPLGSAARER